MRKNILAVVCRTANVILAPPGSYMPEVGELAPDFSLPSTSGDLNLRTYSAGRKLVIAFYVEDMTPG